MGPHIDYFLLNPNSDGFSNQLRVRIFGARNSIVISGSGFTKTTLVRIYAEGVKLSGKRIVYQDDSSLSGEFTVHGYPSRTAEVFLFVDVYDVFQSLNNPLSVVHV